MNLELLCTDAINPRLELGAYEELWKQPGQSFKKIRELISPSSLMSSNLSVSSLVPEDVADQRWNELQDYLRQKNLHDVEVLFENTIDFPAGLKDAKYPLACFYYRGNLDLAFAPKRVAVVGTRNPTDDGRKRARVLARKLADDGIVVVSGLARGIDTEALSAAIQKGGKTIGVIGTPITEVYPKENSALQEKIAREHLLISQVPILRYLENRNPQVNRIFFPERNITMSALSDATVIVEAGETSGTLIQARAALQQGRKVFILNSCFESGLKWPTALLAKPEAKGLVFRVKSYEEMREILYGNAT